MGSQFLIFSDKVGIANIRFSDKRGGGVSNYLIFSDKGWLSLNTPAEYLLFFSEYDTFSTYFFFVSNVLFISYLYFTHVLYI